MIRCIVVDDEPLAREGIANYILEIEFLKLAASCGTALEALNILEKEAIDLVFLDIQMPKLSGLEFLRSLKDPPLTIITTAYPSFALEGYELDIVDFIVKPITLPRFLKAVKKAKKHYELQQQPRDLKIENDYFFIRTENKYEKIRTNDILFLESMQNYVGFHTAEHTYFSLITLKTVLKELPESRFIQTHKSFVANIGYITAIEGNSIVINGQRIPISRSYKDELLNKLLKNKILKK